MLTLYVFQDLSFKLNYEQNIDNKRVITVSVPEKKCPFS